MLINPYSPAQLLTQLKALKCVLMAVGLCIEDFSTKEFALASVFNCFTFIVDLYQCRNNYAKKDENNIITNANSLANEALNPKTDLR